MNLKTFLKNIISKTGYTIVNNNFISKPEILQKSMFDALNSLKKLNYVADLIVDVGAGSGTAPLLSAFPNATFILIEPLVEFLPKLEALKEKFKIQKILTAAVGAQNAEITINVHHDLYGSSLYNESDGAAADGVPRKVKMVKLREEIRHIDSTAHNILKVDVQGAELDVLNSAEELLDVFDVIILEVSFFNFLNNTPDFATIINYMADKNYVVYDMFDFHNRPIDNALAQVDILFVKRDGFFRNTHSYADLKTRREMGLVK